MRSCRATARARSSSAVSSCLKTNAAASNHAMIRAPPRAACCVRANRSSSSGSRYRARTAARSASLRASGPMRAAAKASFSRRSGASAATRTVGAAGGKKAGALPNRSTAASTPANSPTLARCAHVEPMLPKFVDDRREPSDQEAQPPQAAERDELQQWRIGGLGIGRQTHGARSLPLDRKFTVVSASGKISVPATPWSRRASIRSSA